MSDVEIAAFAFDTAAKIEVSMAKPIELPFAEKTASELASRLGVSKARQKRIFAIVEGQHAKSTSPRVRWASRKAKTQTAKKAVAFTSRPRQRSNAKAAR